MDISNLGNVNDLDPADLAKAEALRDAELKREQEEQEPVEDEYEHKEPTPEKEISPVDYEFGVNGLHKKHCNCNVMRTVNKLNDKSNCNSNFCLFIYLGKQTPTLL